MTRKRQNPRIDVKRTVEEIIRDAQHAIAERVQRELRYSPEFHGTVTVGVMIQQGVPRGIKIEIGSTVLTEPVTE